MNKQGYTLIELMVILSIILILSAMAIPAFEGMRDRAKLSVAKDTMNALRVAQVLYRQDRNVYTDSLTRLYPYVSSTAFLRELNTTPTITVNITAETFTILSQAKDSKFTPLTATEITVLPR